MVGGVSLTRWKQGRFCNRSLIIGVFESVNVEGTVTWVHSRAAGLGFEPR